MMKNSILSYVVILFSFQSIGQELLNVSNTLYLHNPAITGIKADLNFVGQYFNSGTIFYGDDEKYSGYFDNYRFGVDGRIPLFRNIKQVNLAAGFAYERDNFGVVTENNWTFSLANHFNFKGGSKFSVGLGYTNHRLFFDNTYAVFPSENSFDPSIAPDYQFIHNRFSAGSLFESSDRTFIVGIGASSETQNQFNYKRINLTLGRLISFGRNMAVSVNTFNEYRFREQIWLFEVPVKLHFKKVFYVGTSLARRQYFSVLAGGRVNLNKAGMVELGAGYVEPASQLTTGFGRGFQVNVNYFFTNPEKNESFSYF